MYLEETKKFYYSFFFILPFLIVYEIGLWQNVLGEKLNGADALLRFLMYFFFAVLGIHVTQWFVALGIIIGLGIFVWYLKKNNIKISLGYILFMFLESVFLAIIFSMVIHLILSGSFPKFFSFQPNEGVQEQLNFSNLNSFWAKVVASIGAGVFEEFLFRVILLRMLYVIFSQGSGQQFGYDTNALIKSIFLGSSFFTLMHFGALGSSGGYISIFVAGIILSFIYFHRGYGIAVGAHAFYDIFLMFGVIS